MLVLSSMSIVVAVDTVATSWVQGNAVLVRRTLRDKDKIISTSIKRNTNYVFIT